ncbi:MAG: hypothetical protein B7Y40_10405 [Gammaproteobacteria bacterium 28-57-27]|nr:MAG: hypothetical protein B7Y40_10405 [Gammaproteobacteria bacterium 28-57-27]
MKKYVVVFAVTYLLLTVALGTIAEMLKIGGGAGLNIAATIASSFVAAWRFTKEQGRLPTAEENSLYTRLALASVWLVSLLLVVAFFVFFMSPADVDAIKKILVTKIFIIAATVGFIVLSAIYYFVIKWSFSWYTKQTYRA